jgi:hypothetical protein
MTVTFIEVENIDGTVTEFAVIDSGTGNFTTMSKADYDAQQAEIKP